MLGLIKHHTKIYKSILLKMLVLLFHKSLILIVKRSNYQFDSETFFFDQIIQEGLNDPFIVQAMEANTLDSFTEFLVTRLLDLFMTCVSGNEKIYNIFIMNEVIKSKVAGRLARQMYEQESG